MTGRCLWGVLLGALACGSYAPMVSAQFLSPGPLSRPHASLEGDQHCAECHASGRQISTSGCLHCHGVLGARIAAGQGLHGRQYRGQACQACHPEHLGAGTRIVRWPGGGPNALDHAQTGWPLDNTHKSVSCNKCHKGGSYIGLPTACASCHQDPHGGRFASTCTQCHREATWNVVTLDSFDHGTARYPLRGAHATVACGKCHGEPAKYVGVEFSSCTSCHKDPHRNRLGATCTKCHNESTWKQVDAKLHPGLSLAAGHAPVACRQCHDKGNTSLPSRGSDCAACHRVVHKAPFGRVCASCHATILWLGLPRTIGLASHARTVYPLAGKHEQVACAACHRPEVPKDARYRKLQFDKCMACHKDLHRGEFASQAGGECKGCHTVAGYLPTLFGREAHGATKYPLTGLHTAVACGGCHGGTRPRVDLHVAKTACVDCHANIHGNQFAPEMARGGCASCHETIGWHKAKIDHTTWPLQGAHAGAACDSCHKPSASDRAAGRGASFRGVPRACSQCHDDVHAGQFRLTQPVLECDRCHSTTRFPIPSFDHAANTHYALTGKHVTVQCAKCHPTTSLRGGAQIARWRLPSTECAYCHANPHARGAR